MVEYINPDWKETFKTITGYRSSLHTNTSLSDGFYAVRDIDYNYGDGSQYSTKRVYNTVQVAVYIPTTTDTVNVSYWCSAYDPIVSGSYRICFGIVYNNTTATYEASAYPYSDDYIYLMVYNLNGSNQEIRMAINDVYNTPRFLTYVEKDNKGYLYIDGTLLVDDWSVVPGSDHVDIVSTAYNNHFLLRATGGEAYIESISYWLDDIVNPIYRPFRRSAIEYDYETVPARVYVSYPGGTSVYWTAIDTASAVTIDQELNMATKATIELDTPGYTGANMVRAGDRVKVSLKDRNGHAGYTAFIGIVPPEGIKATDEKTTITAYDYVSLLANSMMYMPDYNGWSVSGAITDIVSGLSYPTEQHPDGLLAAMVEPIAYGISGLDYDGWVSRLSVIKDILNRIPRSYGVYGFTVTYINDTPYLRVFRVDSDNSSSIGIDGSNMLYVRGERVMKFANSACLKSGKLSYKNSQSVSAIGEYVAMIDSVGDEDEDYVNLYRYVNTAMQNYQKLYISHPALATVPLGGPVSITNTGLSQDGDYIVSRKTIKKSTSVDRCEIELTLPFVYYFN